MSEILRVEHVSKSFPLKGGGTLQAVRGVSFRQETGETLGVVGESGCGKSTLARLILHLLAPSSGEVFVKGESLGRLTPAALRRKRRHMQMVFQDPQTSLDPRMRVGRLLDEPLAIHGAGSPAERARRVAELCELVGLPGDAQGRYPHEFSGGQRQRISIARALALEPALIVADEPVSALDVSVQAQILNLLLDVRRRFMLSYVFISHDLAVVRYVSDRVAVMYLGEIVEMAEAEDFFAGPGHPYAQMLLSAVLDPDDAAGRAGSNEARPARMTARGEPPSPEAPPAGCSFHPRCPFVMENCRHASPPPFDIGRRPGQSHSVRCWLHA